jgi:hypothetical protein
MVASLIVLIPRGCSFSWADLGAQRFSLTKTAQPQLERSNRKWTLGARILRCGLVDCLSPFGMAYLALAQTPMQLVTNNQPTHSAKCAHPMSICDCFSQVVVGPFWSMKTFALQDQPKKNCIHVVSKL